MNYWKESKKSVTCVYKKQKDVSLNEKYWKDIVTFFKKLKDNNNIPILVYIWYHTEMPDYMHVVVETPQKFDELIETAERLSKDYE